MKPENLLDAIRLWVSHQGLAVSLIVTVPTVALKAAAVLNRRMFARLLQERQDAASQKLAQTVTPAAHWIISLALSILGGNLITLWKSTAR